MPLYRLTSPALRDLARIMNWLTREAGPATAIRMEDSLFKAFELLAKNPGIGHSRSDLTPREVLFHPVRPYVVVYEPGASPMLIHAILHGARDSKTILRSRLR